MTSIARASISSLPLGHEFAPASFSVSRAQVDAYLSAVGDANAYGETIPPLAVVALGLNALQKAISLPEGSLHTGQEVKHEGVLRNGEALTFSGRIAQRSERQGFVISVIEFEVGNAGGAGIRARTTIMAPGAGG